jgi:predicted RNA methylase
MTKKIDQIYTPPSLAKFMIDSVSRKKVDVIADFSVGDGILLKTAETKWKKARFIAVDVDNDLIETHTLNNSTWDSICLNFLDNSKSDDLSKYYGKIQLILLNPPFSERGSSYCTAQIFKTSIRCSRSVFFLIESIKYLSKKGEIICILPLGVMKNQRNINAWKLINSYCNIEVLKNNSKNVFLGYSLNTCVVKISLKASKDMLDGTKTKNVEKKQVSRKIQVLDQIIIQRGHLSVNKNYLEGNFAFVHSTELVDGKVIFSKRTSIREKYLVKSPCILLSRVGRPSKNKICLIKHRRKFVISDCILLIKSDVINLEEIHKKILENWNSLEEKYIGTAAAYLTLSQLASFLENLGFSVRVE